jgi:low affinity Fe/Cu permease
MKPRSDMIEKLAHKANAFSGSTLAFGIALSTILIWLIAGPFFGFSDTWQLVINTGTTIVTFLMVFLIQRMQNKDSRALHLKLNELVAALHGPSNRLIDVEFLSEKDLEILSKYYKKLAEMAKKERTLAVSHSIEEAVELHKIKYTPKDQNP